MKRTMGALLGGLLLLVPAFAFAQEIAPSPSAAPTRAPAGAEPLRLDLKTAVSLAEKNNYALKGAQVDVDVKRTAARTSWSVFYPSVSLDGDFTAGRADPAAPSVGRNNLSAGLSAGITLNPTMALQVKSAWNAYQAGLAGYEQAYATLVNNVKKFYFGLLLLGEQAAETRVQADADKARYDVGAFKYRNGFMSEIDMLTLEYAWKNRLYALRVLENDYESGLRQLKDVCGIDPDAEVTLTGAVPDIAALDFDPAGRSVDNGPDLKVLGFSKAQAEIARDNAAAALFPALTLGARFSGGWSTDPFANPIFDASSWSWDASASLTVGLSVPLDAYLPYSQTQNSLMLQDASVQKLAYDAADQRQAALRRADTLLLTLKQVRSQIDSLGINIALARRNLDLNEQLYASGKRSFLDVKDAENSLRDAHVRLGSATNDYLSALLDLGYLYGVDVGL